MRVTIVGGTGLLGSVIARTLVQAGHRVTLLEAEATVGGRMATRDTPFGTFDHGAQYFTVRDPRFAQALETVPGLCKPWSATMVRVLDTFGRVAAAGLANGEPHWVATPGMDALPRRWAEFFDRYRQYMYIVLLVLVFTKLLWYILDPILNVVFSVLLFLASFILGV